MTEIQEPPTAHANRPVFTPGSGGTTAMIVIGILLFIGGWAVIASAPDLSIVDSLLSDNIVNTPSLVQKSAGGVMLAAVGGVLFAAGLVRQHVEAWARWVHAVTQRPGN